jgi:hypothetical protein
MPETMVVAVYLFEELDDDAKERARAWWREAFSDDDFDSVTSDFEQICEILGVELATYPVRLYGGGTRRNPCVFWSHLYCQGQGARFEGTYRYAKGSTQAIRDYAPIDNELHRIADELQKVQKANFYQLRAKVGYSPPYNHEYCMVIDVERDSPTHQDMTEGAEEAITRLLRDLAVWLLKQVLTEDEYRNSDEYVDEAITINEYRFTKDGDRCARL